MLLAHRVAKSDKSLGLQVHLISADTPPSIMFGVFIPSIDLDYIKKRKISRSEQILEYILRTSLNQASSFHRTLHARIFSAFKNRISNIKAHKIEF